MSQIEQLKSAVKALPKSDFEEFRLWFIEHENELWDQQIERDSYDENSPIMKMALRALAEHKKGKSKKL